MHKCIDNYRVFSYWRHAQVKGWVRIKVSHKHELVYSNEHISMYKTLSHDLDLQQWDLIWCGNALIMHHHYLFGHIKHALH